MGSPIAEWHAKSLGAAQDNIYSKLPRRLQNTESQKVSSAAGKSLRGEVNKAVSLSSEGMLLAWELGSNTFEWFLFTCTALMCKW